MVSLGGNCAVAYQLKQLGLRKISLPFDWCSISINKLIKVLENNFKDYINFRVKKKSESHNSLLLINSYNILFAHDIQNNEDIYILKKKMKKRIKLFLKLKNPIFYRLETGSLNKITFEKRYKKLYELLKLKFNNFKLIIISNQMFKTDLNIKFYIFKNFSKDWKYPNINWKNIFNFQKQHYQSLP